MNKNFPVNVFRDIEPQDFNKFNKKEVTEDFVAENFKLIGWNVYKPFVDTGIDLIITKNVCPEGHTKWNENTKGNNICNQCGKDLILIKRFIQIKTRELKEEDTSKGKQFFGYTLKSKDFRTDPRHVFLLYSDFSSDFLLFTVYDYLKLFQQYEAVGRTHFANNSFRVGNNKLNFIKYNKKNKKWSLVYGKGKSSSIDLDNFLNEKGVEEISNPQLDLRLNDLIEETAKIKCDLFYRFQYQKEKTETEENYNKFIEKVNSAVENLRKYNNEILEKIVEMRKKDKETFCNKVDKSIKESVNKYWQKFNIKC